MTVRLTRLKTRGDFLRVAAGRVRAVRPALVLQAAPRPGDEGAALRVGYTASRRVGNAVARNRAKRRLRAAAASVLARQGRAGTDYVLIARAGTGARPYAEAARRSRRRVAPASAPSFVKGRARRRRMRWRSVAHFGSVIGLLLRAAIRAYQLLLAPVLPPACRYLPSCSH